MRRTLFVVLLLGVLACNTDSADDAERRKPRHVDAAQAVDAAPPGDPTQAGVVACYSEGGPSNTCTLPVHCCFDNYSAQHNGGCMSTECNWGKIVCDGPEDCGSGLHCCATASRDPDLGTTGYQVACKASCDGPPLDHELCHDSSTCGARSCVPAYGNANDLPRALSVCL